MSRTTAFLAGALLGSDCWANPLVDPNGDGVPDASPERLLVMLNLGEEGAREADLSDPGTLKSMVQAVESGPEAFVARMLAREGIESVERLGVAGEGGIRPTFMLTVDLGESSLGNEFEAISQDPAVSMVEPDFIEHQQTEDPYFSSSGAWGQGFQDQWYLHMSRAPEAWSRIPGDAQEVVVAVIDSGIDRQHPDLENVLWRNAGEIPDNGVDDDRNGHVDDVHGWNFASENADSGDRHGHGTLVAGFIAAEHDNLVGIAGAATGVEVMALRNGESGRSYVSDSLASLYYAVDNGARVVNMSFGGSNYSRAFAEAIRYALDHDVVLVASAGNAGENSRSHYPSGYSGVISVGASDHLDRLAGFSNYGSRVDLVAPGGGGSEFGGRTMLGCRAAGTDLGDVVDDLHVRVSGTSFSSPLVAAGAAMLLRKEPSLNPAEVLQILIRSCEDIGLPGWDAATSHGRLDMSRALEEDRPAVAEMVGVEDGQVVTGSISIRGTVSAVGFSGYELAYGRGLAPDSWQLIASGDEPLNDGLLGVWDTSELAVGDHTLRLLTLSGGHPVGEARVVVYLGNRPPDAREGWPVGGLVNTEAPTVMDLDGDGLREIVMPTGRGVKVFAHDGEAFRAGSYEGLLIWPAGPASVGDIDGDGELEIGMISKSGTSSVYPEFAEVRFWNLDGSTCDGWPIDLVRNNNFVPHTLAPTVIDVDGDGVSEVLFPSSVSKGGNVKLHLVDGDGKARSGWPKTIPGSSGKFIHSTTGAADLDGDGLIDFVFADSSGKVHALDQEGDYLPGWPKSVASGSFISQEITLSDLDRDGRTEVIAAFYDGTVGVLDYKGSMVSGWPKDLGSIPRPPAIADLDGDGDLEMAIGTQSGTLNVLKPDGTALPGWPKLIGSRLYSPSLVDLNNDGALDVIASDGNRTLHAWNADGELFGSLGFPFQLPGNFGCYSPPVAEDLDGDGLLEVAVACNGLEVRNLAAIANPRVRPFSHMHCDPANTCRYLLPGQIHKNQRFLLEAGSTDSINLAGLGFLAGSKVTIGSDEVALDSLTSESIVVASGEGLAPGWHDILVDHPDTGPSWLAKSVLVVEDRFGDSDGDELPDQWEWDHGFDPMGKGPATSLSGPLGDPDRDGIVNLVEAGFAAMNLDPHVPDAHLLPGIDIAEGVISATYQRDSSSRMRIALGWSSDLSNWLLPGDPDYPLDFTDRDLGTGTSERVDREIRFSAPAGGSGFSRWVVEGPEALPEP